MLVDSAKEVIPGDMVFKVKCIEKAFLAVRLKPHHSKALR
jgi:hypothetical protein